MVKDMKNINVLNYNESIVTVNTKHDGYKIEAGEENNPSILPLTLDEILYINANSNAFKTGLLRFPEEIEKEMYEDYLKIPTWESFLKPSDIKDIILNPTVDGLNKLISIKDSVSFDRVKAVFIKLKNTTDYDISMRVEDIINNRSLELRRGIRNSAIVIKAKDAAKRIVSEDVDALRKQNELLQTQMLEMQKMMQEMMNNQSHTIAQNAESNVEIATTDKEPVKKAGRPKKN